MKIPHLLSIPALVASLAVPLNLSSGAAWAQDQKVRTAAGDKETPSSQTSDMPSMLGVTLGAPLAEVEKALKITKTGYNSITGGPQFETPVEPHGIEGLKEVILIFDKQGKLAATLMSLDAGGFGKPRFDRILGHLKGKYKTLAVKNPPVGDKLANFETKGAKIDLVAAHMSFDMRIFYKTREFDRAAKDVMRRMDEEKARQEAQRL